MEINKLDSVSQDFLNSTLRFPSTEIIVQELIKNSLKGFADYIEIDITDCELSVKDNGVGIPYDILKSNSTESSIRLLGKITDMVIYTKSDGPCFKFINSALYPSCALQKQGTIIILKSLYDKTPARKLFLSKNVVLSIISSIEPLILISPFLRLKVYYKTELITEFQKANCIKERISTYLNVSNIVYVKFVGEILEIEGYISHYTECLVHDKYQYLYYNLNQWLQVNILARINAIYSKATKIIRCDLKKRYPIVLLNFVKKDKETNELETLKHITIILNEITIMIKEQIFKGSIVETVCDALLTKISYKRQKPEWSENKFFSIFPDIDDTQLIKSLESGEDFEKTRKKVKNNFKPEYNFKKISSPLEKKNSITKILPNNLQSFKHSLISNELNTFKINTRSEEITIGSLLISKIIGQVDRKFIIGVINVNDNSILTVFDQHAAHERVQLESLENTLMNDLSSENCKILLTLTNYDRIKFTTYKNTLERFNFCVKEEGERFFLVKIPVLYGIAFSVSDFFSAIHSESTIPIPLITAMKYRSCRTAVKFGDNLNLTKCLSICEDLSRCKLFDKCAHGRPTFYPIMKYPFKPNLKPPVFKLLRKNFKVNQYSAGSLANNHIPDKIHQIPLKTES